MKSEIQISKFLSFVLRHRPDEIGVQLDPAGWIDVDELLSGCKQHDFEISRAQIESVVKNSDKQRFALSDDKKRIRANQGHSVPVDPGYEPATPPAILHHGTATRFIDSIRATGLSKRTRTHVHLSSSIDTARAVGERHGKLALLEVDAEGMMRDGHIFYLSANGVWLTESVPWKYIKFPT